jgi:hypothetical protein
MKGRVQYNLDASGFEWFVFSRFEELIEIDLHQFHDEMEFVCRGIQKGIQDGDNVRMSWDRSKRLLSDWHK